jgi:hypothetical protein
MDREQIVWTDSRMCGQTANCVERQQIVWTDSRSCGHTEQIVWTELGASEWLGKRRYKLDIQHHK